MYCHYEKFTLTEQPQLKPEIVNENVGKGAQHLSVYPLGTNKYNIYIKLLKKNENGNTTIVLDDTFKIIDEFDNYPGVCCQIVNNNLYTSGPNTVYRYTINPESGLVENKNNPALIVRGLQASKYNISPVFIVDKDEQNIYVHIPSTTNACQPISNDRKSGIQGEMPCSRLRLNGGVWKFNLNDTNHTIDTGYMYGTGIRNMRTMSIYKNILYGIIQGRDSLKQLYPEYYSDDQDLKLASDELVQIFSNSNFGYPYCYWDGTKNKRILMPEYGGDGTITKQCNTILDKPILSFDYHMGPNDSIFTDKLDWGEQYSNSMFIAWNGPPRPLKCPVDVCGNLYISVIKFDTSMKPTEHYELIKFKPSDKFKPSGLTIAPDNSILVTDSLSGKLLKISFGF